MNTRSLVLVGIMFPCLLATPLAAQERSDVSLAIWTAPIPSTQGSYSVALNAICSVALEHYTLKFNDETYPISECSIETVGGKTARFYYIDDRKEKEKDRKEKDSLINKARAVGAKVVPEMEEEDDEDDPLRVLKTYPESVLSGTVEYRLATKEDVKQLYRDLSQMWKKLLP